MLNFAKTHVVAVFALLVLTVAFYNPIIFKKKIIKQSDIEQGVGINEESRQHLAKNKEISLWFGSVFSGMPSFILGNPFSDDIKNKIYSAITFATPEPVGIHLVMMICAYVLGFVVTKNVFLSLFFSVVFTFTTFNILSLEAGHNAKIRAMAYLPLVLAGIALLNEKKWLVGVVVAALGVAFHINCAHYQISYYFFLAVGAGSLAWLAFQFVQKNALHAIKVLTFFGLATILGIGSNFGKIWSSMDYQKQSIRGKYELTPKESDNRSSSEGLDKDYAFSWSQGVTESLTFFIPGVFGGSSSEELSKGSAVAKELRNKGIAPQPMPLYFGDQPFTGGPIYAGVAVCFFFVLSFFVLKKNEIITSSIVFALFMMVAWGKNFEALNYFLFDYFPYFNKFRAVSMALYVPLFVMAVVALLVLYRIIETEDKKSLMKPIAFAAGGLGFVALVLMIAPSLIVKEGPSDAQLPEWIMDALMQDRSKMVSADALRSFFFLALVAGSVFAFVQNLIKKEVLCVLILLISLIDLWAVNGRYLTKDDYVAKKKIENQIQPTEANLAILNDKELGYRVFNLQNPFNDGRTSYFHRSIGGYHPAKMRRYQDLIENHLSENNRSVIRMLNVKYAMRGNSARDVIPMPDRCGAAWFVDSIKRVKSPDEENEALKNFEPSTTAILDEVKFPNVKFSNQEPNATGEIKLVSFTPNAVEYVAKTNAERLAVFSEIYYMPGWQATINGQKADHFRVNYVLRAMIVPAGENKIVFTFQPETYTKGKTISMIFNILVFGLAFVAVGIGVKKSRDLKEANKL